MQAGLMTERVRVLRRVVKADGFGSSLTEWEAAASAWAKVDYRSSGFGVSQGEAVYRSQVAFTMRYDEAAAEYCRVEWQGRLYRITGIERWAKRGEMRLVCELVTQD